jgi:hypothetical protein
MTSLLEVATSLTRASVTAKHEGRRNDARRIDRALAALLTLDHEDSDERETMPGTQLGMGAP